MDLLEVKSRVAEAASVFTSLFKRAVTRKRRATLRAKGRDRVLHARVPQPI